MILEREKHQMIMGRILHDIADDVFLAPTLGFKGGTCAYLFYALPRFSVDLDFDLLKNGEDAQNDVYARIEKIVKRYGLVRDVYVKRNTIFFLLSYGEQNHNIKIEINTRSGQNIRTHYEMRQYLGASFYVVKKDYMFAMKLAALLSRSRLVIRDVFDIHYFADQGWDIDTVALENRVGESTTEYLGGCIAAIEKIKKNQLLTGIGQLIDEKQKVWVRDKLIPETVFLLRNYARALSAKK